MLLLWFSCLLAVPYTMGAPVDNHYIVETRIVIEKSAFDQWKALAKSPSKIQLRREMNSYMVEVNELFKGLHKYGGLDIEFSIQDVDFVDKIIPQENPTNPEDDFINWLKKNPLLNKNADLSILFTSQNLTSRTLTKRILGTICTDQSVIVMSFPWKEFSDGVVKTAHDIGHLLGAYNEGNQKNEEANKCQNEMEGMNVMALEWKIFGEYTYYFSKCSYAMMDTTLNQLQNNCLKDGKKDSVVTGPRLGAILSIDEMCQRSFGISSYALRTSTWFYDTYLLCRQVQCYSGDPGSINTVRPTPGLYCGKNKQCLDGKCVLSEAGGKPGISDYCPFGDQTKLDHPVYKTCAHVPKSECSKWKYQCCITCNLQDFGKADEVCRGKEGTWSSFARYKYKTTNYGDEMCTENGLICEFFVKDGFRRYVINARGHTAPDGLGCGQNKRCVDHKCVVTPDGNPNMPDQCPYGAHPFLLDYELLVGCNTKPLKSTTS